MVATIETREIPYDALLLGNDPRDREIRSSLEAGFGAFGRYCAETFEPQELSLVTKHRTGLEDPVRPSWGYLLLLRNAVWNTSRLAYKTQWQRYNEPGEMLDREFTWHPNVAVSFRKRFWRSLTDGEEWTGDVRIRFWGEFPHQQFGSFPPGMNVALEGGFGRNFTTVTFPVYKREQSQTTVFIDWVLRAANPRITGGYRPLP